MSQKSILFHRLGFTEGEELLYRTLALRGPLSIADLCRATGLYRPAIYAALPRLAAKGALQSIKKGKRVLYAAESPRRLMKLAEDFAAAAIEELAALEDAYAAHGRKPLVSYREGAEAISAVYSDVVESLPKGGMYFRYAATGEIDRERYVPKDYRMIRDRKGLERLVITNEPNKKRHALKLGREIKAIPKDFDLFEDNVAQIVYGNKVAIIDYNTRAAITIENKVIADFQKKLFKLLFKKL
jgi:hypothetical protein